MEDWLVTLAPEGRTRATVRRLDHIAFGFGLLLVACALLLGQLYHWPQIADDSFIFSRYAMHLGSGQGLVWNPGELPVEGFSSPLWVSILGAASALGLDPVLTGKALGVMALALTVPCCGLLALKLSGSRWAALVAMTAASVSKPLHYWAPSGMETGLYAALVVSSLLLLVSRRAVAGALVLGLAGIGRPEGPLLAAAVSAAYAWTAPAGRRAIVPALALAPSLIYQGFRLVYFGELFANTYFAKVGGPLGPRLLAGAVYSAHGLVLWGAAIAALVYLFVRRPDARARARSLALLVIAATALLIPVVWSGGDWMWHGRFLCPSLPVLLAAVAASCALALERSADGRRDRTSVVTGLLIAGAGLYAVGSLGLVTPRHMAMAARGSRLPVEEIQEGTMTEASRELGLYLKNASGGRALIAVNHAGAVPFYSELATIDMTGLNDHHIAHRVEGVLHEKFDPDYVLARRPDYIVLNSRLAPNSRSLQHADGTTAPIWYLPGYWEGETALVQHQAFRRSYRFIPRYWVWSWVIPRNYILVAERLPDAEPAPEPSPGGSGTRPSAASSRH
jgi:arabinofuranosyltransferase